MLLYVKEKLFNFVVFWIQKNRGKHMKRNKIIVRAVEIFTALIGILMAFVGKNFVLSYKPGPTIRRGLFKAIDITRDLNVLRLSSVLYVVSLIVLFITAIWFILLLIAEISKNEKLAGPLNDLSLVTACYFGGVILLVGLAALFTSVNDASIKMRFYVSFKSVFTYLYLVGAACSVAGEVFLLKTEKKQ